MRPRSTCGEPAECLPPSVVGGRRTTSGEFAGRGQGSASGARDDVEKRVRAREVLRLPGIGLSAQVMQEFYDAGVHKKHDGVTVTHPFLPGVPLPAAGTVGSQMTDAPVPWRTPFEIEDLKHR